jgi:putative hemolysin
MTQIVEQIKQTARLRWNGVYSFKAKIKIHFTHGSYTIKTIDTQPELIEALRLRHEVFHREYRNLETSGLDLDQFDQLFDHLIIRDNETHKIIGTYRLSLLKSSRTSYTATEFDLTDVLDSGETFLELGRACINKEYRKGSVVLLLWRGIAEYMNHSGATALIGCSSIKVSSTRDAALIYKFLEEQGYVEEEISSFPKATYAMRDFDIWYMYFRNALTYYQANEAKEMIPSLMNSYLRMGAKVICEPAYDEDFRCIDLLTILKKEDLSNSLARRFRIE